MFKVGDIVIVEGYDIQHKYLNVDYNGVELEITDTSFGSKWIQGICKSKHRHKDQLLAFDAKYLKYKYKQIAVGQYVGQSGARLGVAFSSTDKDGKIRVRLDCYYLAPNLMICGPGGLVELDANNLDIMELTKDTEFEGESKPAFVDLVEAETARSIDLHGDHKSLHESYGILMEEVDEFWDEVKLKPENRDKERIKAELVQIASVAMKAFIFVEENM